MLETYGSLSVEGRVLAESVPVWIDLGRKTAHWKGAIMLPPEDAPASGTIAHLELSDGRSGEIAVEQRGAGTDGKVLVRFVGTGPLEVAAS